jgi:transmembrane 9 superfamily protein 3
MRSLQRISSIFLTFGVLVGADEYNHRYTQGDSVHFYVNKVGPYANPQEAYDYYSLPYCAPENEKGEDLFNQLRSNSIGEYLGGHALRHSGHMVKFAPTQNTFSESCTTKAPLTESDAEMFALAASNTWVYQMYLDDLPIWGVVGEMIQTKGGDLKPHVYTKRTLQIKYNKDRIVEVDLMADPQSLVEVKAGISLTFKTKFQWEPTKKEFHSRFDKYLDQPFFKHHIHWFSIFNSFMMVLFLMGLVALILVRTLRKDYAKYGLVGLDDEESDEEEGFVDDNGKMEDPLMKGAAGGMPNEDSGWKQVHGDVFRAPYLLPVIASILGTGSQLIALTLGVILFAVAGPLHGQVHEDRGEMQHAVLICYCFSSVVAGYTSGSYFKQYNATKNVGRGKSSTGGGSQWQLTMFLTVMLLPTVFVSILSILNGIALAYKTVNYIPFLVIVKLFFIWILLSVPLCVIGTLAGRHASVSSGDFPCRVNAIARPIPEDVPFHGKPINLIPFAGLLSFGSIFIELYYVLTSLWNYKVYHVYGFLLAVYAILAVVVSMTTIIVVYFCLNAENYLWQWTAMASGGSTAGYVFLYGIYYFLFKTQMTGFLQTMFYFGYMSLISLTLGTLSGTIGHFAANRFVRTIFSNVKVD